MSADLTPEQLDRFWTKVDKGGECWRWTGQVTEKGYGRFTVTTLPQQVRVRVHRLAYELLVGPIPDGLVIDHLCRVRDCVNPDHLEVVTVGENVRRGLLGRLRGAEATEAARTLILAANRPPWPRTHCVNGHEYTDENTTTSGGQRRCVTCRRASAAKRRSSQRQLAS